MEKKPVTFPDDPEFVFFDEEERELIESIEKADENGELLPVEPQQEWKKAYQQSAERHLASQDKEIRISLPNQDLIQLREQAEASGMAPEVLASRVLHQYIHHQLGN